MPNQSTSNFLPPYLQSVANKRFLGSTLDLLTNPPQIDRFSGYVGRQFFNGQNLTGSYLLESTPVRQNYQLEAGFVTTDSFQNITNTANFIDLLNSCADNAAITNAWNRLLTSGLYSWQGFTDLDKIINYQNYCWLSTSDTSWAGKSYWNTGIILSPDVVATSIIGLSEFTDPNNISLLNGMVVTFSSNNPAPYNTGLWIVEGVGKEINLIPTTQLITPSFLQFQNIPPDYITISRNAADRNLWSRTNLWVHKNTINSVISILATQNSEFVAPLEFTLANRPILEFVPMVLFGSGKIGLDTVTYYDNYTIDAFSIVQGSTNFEIDGLQLNSGDSVIFAADNAPSVRQNIYNVEFVDTALSVQVPRLYPVQAISTNNINLYGLQTIDGYVCKPGDRILITGQSNPAENGIYLASALSWEIAADFYTMQANETNCGVLVLYGTNNKLTYFLYTGSSNSWTVSSTIPVISLSIRDTATDNNVSLITAGLQNSDLQAVWNNSSWQIASQNKTAVNQTPLFDIFDLDNISLANNETYSDSSFSGTELFSYQIGDGVVDSVLGFPLTYGPIGNLNDVIFENNYVIDTFTYGNISSPQNILIGKAHLVDPINHTEIMYDCWTYADCSLELYQNIAVTGKNIIKFSGNLLVKRSSNSQKTQVYVNGQLLDNTQFTVQQNNNIITVTISSLINVASDSQILIKILSSTPIPGAWYDVPPSFDHNPLGQNLNIFNMGTLREHATVLQENANDFTGIITIQNLNFQGVPGNILYSESLALLPTLLLCNNTFNIDQALRTAAEDYILYKQRFKNILSQISNIQLLSAKQAVDQVLQTIAESSAPDDPWSTSDMCYWGGIERNIIISNISETVFNLSQAYDWNQPNQLSIQIYLNDKILLLNKDYKINGLLLNIIYPLNPGDILAIYEISNTDGSYIPATPAKLGLSALYTPEIYTDYNYQTPRNVLRGHDGSITTCYGDYRDNLLLDFESRIYNNIKVNNQLVVDIIETNVPSGGRWRSEQALLNADISPYSPEELLSIEQKLFCEWTAEYNVNYQNSVYDQNDLFTWNYSSCLDKVSTHRPMLGYWRGIYRWFFDTENVNTCPWEMLNLAIKPDWWDSIYGEAPYTGTNAVLWNDIANGIIRDPSGIKTSSFGARSFLNNNVSAVIPIDSSGNLLDPNDSIVGTLNTVSSQNNFVFGDGGPGETAWRHSSAYPYSKLRAQIRQNPLFMLGTLWDTNNYLPVNGISQFRYNNLYLGSVSQITLNSIDNNGSARVNSIVNYSIEYLRRQGQNPNQLREVITNTTPKLIYSLGGFSDPNDLDAFALPNNPNDINTDNLIPLRDYELFLNCSTPVGNLNYSGLIISTTSNGGYTISGYNLVNPYFTIYPAILYGITTNIGVAPNFYKYPTQFSSVTQTIPYNTIFNSAEDVINFIAGYEKFLISNGLIFETDPNQAKVTWNSSAVQFIKWSLTNWDSEIPLSIVLNPSASIIEYIASSGTLYDLTDSNESLLLDINGASIENKYLDVYRDKNTVTITNQGGEIFGCLSAKIVSYEHRVIFDNITVFDDTIYDPISGIRQQRLQLSGQKSANWNGTLDSPGFLLTTNQVASWNPNQDYLLGSLVTFKNNNYVATQDVIGASTFQYSNFKLISTVFTNSILPNLSLKSVDYVHSYDINYRPFLNDLITLRNNTIGYIERDWLSALSIDLGAQTDFYKGWIKEKGTLNSLNSYGRGSTLNLNTQVAVNEEYAIKVGVYGSDTRTGYGDINLPASVNTQNPLVIKFVDTPDRNDTNTIQVVPSSLYEKSTNWTNDFISTYGNLKINNQSYESAGPVIPNELILNSQVNIPNFTIADINSLFFSSIDEMIETTPQDSILKIGENNGSFWIKNNVIPTNTNKDSQWDVITFRVIPTAITSISQLDENTINFILTTDIKATANSVILIDYTDAGSNIAISGMFKINSYTVAPFKTSTLYGISNLCISTTSNQFGNVSVSYNTPITTSGIYLSRSLRSSSIAQSNINLDDNTRYVVTDMYGEAAYNLTTPFTNSIFYPDSVNRFPITSIAYDQDKQVVWSGKPGADFNSSLGQGIGLVEMRPIINTINSSNLIPTINTSLYLIESQTDSTVALGNIIVANNGIMAATANSLNNGPAQIYICETTDFYGPSINQILSGDYNIGSSTISSIAMSNDSNWLYIAIQPNISDSIAGIAVYALHENSVSNYEITSIAQTGSSTILNLNQNISNPFSISINILNSINYTNRLLIPNLEYTTAGTVVTITPAIDQIGTSNIQTKVNALSKYYAYQGTLNHPSQFNELSQFGSSIASDDTGSICVVGAPGANSVAIFNRITEYQYQVVSVSSITLNNNFTSIAKVFINGILQRDSTYTFTSPTLNFSPALPATSTIEITGFSFANPQIISSPDSKALNFGYSVAIKNNQLAIGSPNMYDLIRPSTGEVYFYALDTSINSIKIIPISDLNLSTDPFNINGWVIRPENSTISGLVNAINNNASYTGVSAYISNSNLNLIINPTLQTTGIIT